MRHAEAESELAALLTDVSGQDGVRRSEDTGDIDELAARQQIDALLASLGEQEAALLRQVFGLDGDPVEVEALIRGRGVDEDVLHLVVAQALAKLRGAGRRELAAAAV